MKIKLTCENCHYRSFVPMDDIATDESCPICNGRMTMKEVDLKIFRKYKSDKMAEQMVKQLVIDKMKNALKTISNEEMRDLVEEISDPIYRSRMRLLLLEAIVTKDK